MAAHGFLLPAPGIALRAVGPCWALGPAGLRSLGVLCSQTQPWCPDSTRTGGREGWHPNRLAPGYLWGSLVPLEPPGQTCPLPRFFLSQFLLFHNI